MKAFAAAGLIAAVSAAQAEATTEGVSTFDATKYYSYGAGHYAYPEYDHKEEHTPVKKHLKHARNYKTNNIDIFAHSDSDDDHHAEKKHHGRGHHDSHSSHSSDDENHMKHKKHMVFLTGEGPEGDHCHPGDWCSSEETSSDYTDSDYQTVEEESSEEHHQTPAPGCGGERCARVDFDWNDLGVHGTMDIYQPYGHAPELLFDGDWDGLTPWSRHEVRIKSLPKYINPIEGWENNELIDFLDDADSCRNTGSHFAWIGSSKADKHGNGSIRSYSEGFCLDDFMGQAIEIRGTYSAYESLYAVLACGNVVEVPCPPRQPHW